MANMDWLLRFDNNLLSGEIPSELGRLSGVRDLDIKFNQLSGQIPSQLGLVNFTWFDFQNNSFTGSIPPELASLWSSLHTFNVQSNSGLTGVVPNELCDLNGTCITNDGHLCPGESGMKFDCTESLCGCDCECGL